MVVFSVRLCHCRGTSGISFVDTPPFPTEEKGGRHFPTPHRGVFPEGGAGIVTDNQQGRERGALVGSQHTHTHTNRVPFQAVDKLNTAVTLS